MFSLVLATCLKIKSPDWRNYCERRCDHIHSKAIREVCRTEKDRDVGKKTTGKRWLTEKDVR